MKYSKSIQNTTTFLYLMPDDFLAGNDPFTTIHGIAEGSWFGQGISFGADSVTSLAETDLTICGSGDSTCFTFTLDELL